MTANLETHTGTVRELRDGDSVDMVLLVRQRETKAKKDGAPYLHVTLADRTGQVTTKVWDNIDALAPVFEPGGVVHVSGIYTVSEKYGAEIKGKSAKRVDMANVDMNLLLDGPERSVEELEEAWNALMLTVCGDDAITALLGGVFDPETWKVFRVAPAAEKIHQPFQHGLLEHTLLVAESVARLARMYDCDYDIAVAGAFCHDIAKVDVYTSDPLNIAITDDGRLFGEIAMSYHKVRAVAERLGIADEPSVRAVLHIIVSHHGKREWGSPVEPCTREASLVHQVDVLGARQGSFDRLEKALPDGQQWSDFDRSLGVRAYFGQPEGEAGG